MGMLHESMRAAPRRPRRRQLPHLRRPRRVATRSGAGRRRARANTVVRMPAGPAVVITPWNAPFMLSTWKVAPALAAGNTVILKPAEWSPLSCSLLADLTVEAGFPPGVFNLVQGIGEEVGPPLVGDPRVKRISFTGSPETARHIGRAAAENIVPFTAELGGKGPLIVFADADLDAAAAKAAGQYDDSGPGLPRRHPAARRGVGPRRVPRPLPRRRRPPRARRQPRPGDDDRPDDPPRPRRPRRGLRRAGPRARRPRRARRPAGRRLAARRADAHRAGVERQRDRPARGVRAGADAADVRRRGAGGRARQLDAATGCRRSSTRRRRSGPSASGGPCAAASCGSTRSSSATSPRRSAASASPASAARAATTPSTSTAT